MIRTLGFLLAGLTSAAAARPFDVSHYAVAIEPDLEKQTIVANEQIALTLTEAGIEQLDLDAGDLTIDAVREGREALRFEKTGSRLRIVLARPSRRGDQHRFHIDYHGTPTSGLEFHPERHELYTVFSNSQWMVAIDAPDERASFDLTLTLPSDLTPIATGAPRPSQREGNGKTRHRWQLATPMPSYVYGFAAGRYTQSAARHASTRLRYASSDLSATQLEKVFADSGDMLAFFADRAGLAYRGDYAHVLVTDTIGQEMAGMSLLSEEYGRSVLEEPQKEGLIAHELAHQWWGNRLTCASWNHFWLNEGFATFMTAAYLQHRFGDEVYAKQVERWQTRLEKLRADGKDRPLVFPDWNHPTGDDRAVVYQKGALALHELRKELGEAAFWRGIRRYTTDNDGRSVTTADFRRAMEQGSGRDLSAFFEQWIEPADVPRGY